MEQPLSDNEMNALLQSETIGHLACCDGPKPYIVPLAFVYHDEILYGQTTEGRKIEILRRNPQVAFQVQRQSNREWTSVICWGTFEELDAVKMDHAQAVMVAELLSKKLADIQQDVGIAPPSFSFGHHVTPHPVNSRNSTLFRIVISEKTGRRYRADPR